MLSFRRAQKHSSRLRGNDDPVHPRNIRLLAFHSRVTGKPVDHIMKLALDQLDLLLGTVTIEQTVPHVDRHPVHVFDLHQHLIRRPAKRRVTPLVGACPVKAPGEVVEVQPAGELDRFVDGAAGIAP